MREVLKKLAAHYKVSIVSGRATDDVKSKVQIDGIFYAGSHGFEILEPDGKVEVNKEAQDIRHVIDEVHSKLNDRLKGVEGALVRNSGLGENFIFTNRQFDGANIWGNHNNTNYHSMQAQVTLRPTHGLSFQASYTWSSTWPCWTR